MTLAPGRIDELDRHLMLIYTGVKRTASDVAQSYVQDLDQREKQINALVDMVDQGISVLNSNQEISAFGKLLDEAWMMKRGLSSAVSNSHVDEIYQAALSAGAIGGKLLGAGGGGFMLLFARPSDQAKVKERLSKLIHVPFKFESAGSQIILYDPEQDYSAEDNARANQSVEAFQELASSDV